MYKTAWQFKRSPVALSSMGSLNFALSLWSVPNLSAPSVGNFQIYGSLTTWLKLVYRQRIRQRGGVLLIPLANDFTRLVFASDDACEQQAEAFTLVHRVCTLSEIVSAAVEPAIDLREYILLIAANLAVRFAFEIGELEAANADEQTRLMAYSNAVIDNLMSSISVGLVLEKRKG